MGKPGKKSGIWLKLKKKPNGFSEKPKIMRNVWYVMIRSQSELKKIAHRIINDAKRIAEEIETDALQYANQILENLEDSLDRTLKVVRKGREDMQSKYKL